MKSSMLAVGAFGLMMAGLCGCPSVSQPVQGTARGPEQEASGDVRASEKLNKVEEKSATPPEKPEPTQNPNPLGPPTPQPPGPPNPPPPR